jgi:hypothetical protein
VCRYRFHGDKRRNVGDNQLIFCKEINHCVSKSSQMIGSVNVEL